ncbi:hypothetical protein CK203_109596 [Vitis vinifera]|uniref:Reverse transcriptase domain-containing protein n=1 Tax=Vitis vinifera TaxID=29760 RepID=A0A438CFR6_VITVI|nr:hypothetical protein CK203_109596 [Vitis vinifera]
MEDEAKPICQPQRRLNPHMQDVVRAEVFKLLQAGIIYPISDSPWGESYSVVSKKFGITVVKNDKGEEVSTRLTIGWRFLRGLWASFLLFLRWLLWENAFGLCYAPATFQRCMLCIISAMVERIMEVFMDDITIYGREVPFHGTPRIVLGHIISKKGIEVDKENVELIVKLPSPTNVKGDANSYGMIERQRIFEELKLFLTTAPIMRASQLETAL